MPSGVGCEGPDMASETSPAGEAADGDDAGVGNDAGAGGDPEATADSETAPDPADHPLPPGPDGYPLVGSAPRFLRDPFAFYDRLAEYGDVVRWRLPGVTFTTLLHPDHVEQVLVADHDRYERDLVGDFDFAFAPDGLLQSDGDQWLRQRRTMQPAFTVERIQSYADAMAGYAERTADRWSDGEEVALNRAFSNLTLRILAKALFDVEVDPSAEDAVIPRAARAVDDRTDATSLTTFLPQWLPTPSNRRYERALAAYRERADELIAERRAAGADGDDLLSLLLTATGPDGAGLSAAEVRDNLLTFTFAGHETTSLGLTYAVLLLSTHDDAAARLRAEVESVVGDGTPTAGDAFQLEFTERVVREALRLHPPAHILVRRATEESVVGGYRVPEGTVLTLPQFHLHTDGRFWDDPESFRPDRWAAETGGDEAGGGSGGADRADERPEYAYFPFGGGPRHCIGMRFAMLEMKLVVAVLARAFEFELLSDPDPAIGAGATHRPKQDVRVRLHERSG